MYENRVIQITFFFIYLYNYNVSENVFELCNLKSLIFKHFTLHDHLRVDEFGVSFSAHLTREELCIQ